MIYSWLTESQLSWMWTALTQWWSWLLHIAIQVMPYTIAMTIILIVFWLVKNWSKLKNKWSSWKTYSSIDEYSNDYRVWINKKKWKKTYVTDDDLDALNFYHDDYVKYNPWNDIYSDWRYYRTNDWRIAINWKSKWKSHTSYYDDDAILFDILPDEEHHYKKRYNMYND